MEHLVPQVALLLPAIELSLEVARSGTCACRLGGNQSRQTAPYALLADHALRADSLHGGPAMFGPFRALWGTFDSIRGGDRRRQRRPKTESG